MSNPTDVGAAQASRAGRTQRCRRPRIATPTEQRELFEQLARGARSANSLDEQLGEMMGDAPMCDSAGTSRSATALATSA